MKKKKITQKLVTLMLVFAMAFCCIPATTLKAEVTSSPEIWDLTDPTIYYEVCCDYGDTVTLTPYIG